jgi:2-desacetyl-2-hydroxyethyl bacteriochlorophyllide A dehydrogenase
MRAFVVTAPNESTVMDVEPPVAGPGQVVVDVHRVGICGTDVELFAGEMAYLHQGFAHYPLRLGHEWAGVVTSVGNDADAAWVGRRVTGDTMLGCGTCRLCRTQRQHVCRERHEIGIRGGWPGALAEQLLVPVTALQALPDSVDDTAGALVEPGGNAIRAVQAARAATGSRVLIYGPGTIGLLCALIAESAGTEVHVVGRSDASLAFARSVGVHNAWLSEEVPDQPYDAIIDCTFTADVPARAASLVEPGGRVVLIGLSGAPSRIDTRDLVLKDVTAVGILSASPGLGATIEHYADGRVDPRRLVAGTVGLDDVAGALMGQPLPGVGAGPKIHIDPRR